MKTPRVKLVPPPLPASHMVALDRGWAWHRADENDTNAPVLARGLADALQVGLPPELFSGAAVYIEGLRALAEAAGAPKYFLRIIERDRYDEQAHLGLVCTLAAAGAHGDARRADRSYLNAMQELGSEPASYPELGAGNPERVPT